MIVLSKKKEMVLFITKIIK